MDSVRSPHENVSLDACWFELFRSFGFKVRFHGYDFSLPISYYQFRKLDTLRSISQRRFQSENGTFPSGIALEKLEVRNCN